VINNGHEISYRPVLTAINGTNADLLPEIFKLYAPYGTVIADVTYGLGVFWKNIDPSKYTILKSDIAKGIDFRSLPYESGTIDMVIIDPPYMHGGATVKDSINKRYQNKNSSHESVIRLYAAGFLEAARVLKQRGRIIVKTQDEIESGKQRLSHIEIIQLLCVFGFSIDDIFVLVQKTVPAMREKYQKSARKNHSFAVVAQLRR